MSKLAMGLPFLGRGIAHDGALSEVQLSEHRMNLRVTEFCSGGESRKRRSGAGRRFGLRKFAVFADRGLHDKPVPRRHRGLLFRSRGKYSVSACRGGADVRSSPLQSAEEILQGSKNGCVLIRKKVYGVGARRDGWSRPLPLGAPRPMIF